MGLNMNNQLRNAKVIAISSSGKLAFVAHLEGIYEHSSWIADRAWRGEPFESVEELHAAMVLVVQNATRDEQLALIRAHPELAGKEAEQGTLTTASTQEQQGAGLNQCSREELERLRDLNRRYVAKFGFPFVIAVKGLSRYQIMDAVEARLANASEVELQSCLNEIFKIAKFRLEALFE